MWLAVSEFSTEWSQDTFAGERISGAIHREMVRQAKAKFPYLGKYFGNALELGFKGQVDAASRACRYMCSTKHMQ